MDFFNQNFLSDCQIIDVFKQSYKCHKIVLASRSDIFLEFFKRNQDKDIYLPLFYDKKREIIDLVNQGPNYIQLTLQFFYGRGIDINLDLETIFGLYGFFYYLQCKSGIKEITELIKTKYLNQFNCIFILKEIYNYNNIQLNDFIIEYIKSQIQRIDIEQLQNLEPNLFFRLISLFQNNIVKNVFDYIENKLNILENQQQMDLHKSQMHSQSQLLLKLQTDNQQIGVQLCEIQNIANLQNNQFYIIKENLNKYLRSLNLKNISQDQLMQIINSDKLNNFRHIFNQPIQSSNNYENIIANTLRQSQVKINKNNNSLEYQDQSINQDNIQQLQNTLRNNNRDQQTTNRNKFKDNQLKQDKEIKRQNNYQIQQNNNQIQQNNNQIQQNEKNNNESIFVYDSEIRFVFESKFDLNGAIYYLGSKGKTQKYKNPFSNKLIQFYSSGYNKFDINLEDKYQREFINIETTNLQYSYFGIDFGENRYLLPSCYTIGNSINTKTVTFNWILEASNDFNNWFIIDQRNYYNQNDPEFNKKYKKELLQIIQDKAVNTWILDKSKIYNALIETNKQNYFPCQGFRYFRIVQITKNSAGKFNLSLTGLEFYGDAYGNWNI